MSSFSNCTGCHIKHPINTLLARQVPSSGTSLLVSAKLAKGKKADEFYEILRKQLVVFYTCYTKIKGIDGAFGSQMTDPQRERRNCLTVNQGFQENLTYPDLPRHSLTCPIQGYPRISQNKKFILGYPPIIIRASYPRIRKAEVSSYPRIRNLSCDILG